MMGRSAQGGAGKSGEPLALDTGWGSRVLVLRASDPAAVAEAGAAAVLSTLTRALDQRGRASLVLAGGSTPLRLYRFLNLSTQAEAIDWRRVDLFFGDERWVEPNDPESNFKCVQQTLLAHHSIGPGRVFSIPTDRSPEACAAAYEDTIRAYFSTSEPRFDCILLGLGVDGHTASLFPGGEALWAGEEGERRWVVTTSSPLPPTVRISLTPYLLNRGRRTLFLVTGESKREIVSKVFSARSRNRFPACRIEPVEAPANWLLDEAASGALW